MTFFEFVQEIIRSLSLTDGRTDVAVLFEDQREKGVVSIRINGLFHNDAHTRKKIRQVFRKASAHVTRNEVKEIQMDHDLNFFRINSGPRVVFTADLRLFPQPSYGQRIFKESVTLIQNRKVKPLLAVVTTTIIRADML